MMLWLSESSKCTTTENRLAPNKATNPHIPLPLRWPIVSVHSGSPRALSKLLTRNTERMIMAGSSLLLCLSKLSLQHRKLSCHLPSSCSLGRPITSRHRTGLLDPVHGGCPWLTLSLLLWTNRSNSCRLLLILMLLLLLLLPIKLSFMQRPFDRRPPLRRRDCSGQGSKSGAPTAAGGCATKPPLPRRCRKSRP